MPTDEQLNEVRTLTSRYVRQLEHGCGNPSCREALCDTGKRHGSHRPTRSWTSRSARAIALAIVSGPSPRKRLCPSYVTGGSRPEHVPATVEEDEGQRDLSSFEQLLCDTSSVRKLCSTDGPLHAKFNFYEDLEEMLDPIIEPIDAEDVLRRPPTNEQAATAVSAAINVCLGDVPCGPTAQYMWADGFIREGSAFPTRNLQVPADPKWNIWLTVLDSFDRRQPNRVLAKVAEAVAARTQLENGIEHLWAQLSDDTPATRISGFESASSSSDHSESRPSDDPYREPARRQKVLPLVIRELEGMTDLPHAIAFVIWMKKLFLLHWAGTATLRHGSTAMGCLLLIEAMDHMWSDPTLKASKVFQLPAVISRLDVIEMAHTWMQHRDGEDGSRHLLSFDFLFDAKERALYFRSINHLKMRQAHSIAERSAALRQRMVPQTLDNQLDGELKYAEAHYLLLNVSRTNILQDTYNQLWQRRSGELFRPLRVRLGEVEDLEIGHDLGGVQIEFFNVICKEVFAEDAQMFMTSTAASLSYFRRGSLQPLYMFELFGLLVGLAVYNGVTIPVNFPLAFYKVLLGGKISHISDLADGWPDHRKALQYILDTPNAEDDVDYTFPLEANGLRVYATYEKGLAGSRPRLRVWDAAPTTYPAPTSIKIEKLEWPGWDITKAFTGCEPPAVPAENKTQYTADYARWLMLDSVAPQWAAFCQGFARLVDRHSISLFSPDGLKAFVEGSTRLDIGELRRTTRYDGYEANSKYMHTFWRVVTSWPQKKQKQLLKFVTAAERIPIGGANNITFVIQKAYSDSIDDLPTSSTCFGTLMLPKYPSADTLDRKLSLAIKYGMEGFGTG